MKRRVRVKPTRTERRTKLARALEETGLGKRGVRIDGDAAPAKAPTRAWKERGQGPSTGSGGREERQRRAFSMPRAGGRITADGPFAPRLVEALRDAEQDDVVAESLTHPV